MSRLLRIVRAWWWYVGRENLAGARITPRDAWTLATIEVDVDDRPPFAEVLR